MGVGAKGGTGTYADLLLRIRMIILVAGMMRLPRTARHKHILRNVGPGNKASS